jgi:hypothetical protein
MANWKKILVSGSDAHLNHITGSTLRLTGTNSSSTITTPLVINSSGEIFTGSAYALASGGTTVGGSSLASNIAIIGVNNTSLIQTASSTQKVDFNNADLEGISDLTASAALIETLKIGEKDSTGSIAFISSSTGNLTIPTTNGFDTFDIEIPITASNIPTSNTLPFYLGVGESGEVIKIEEADVAGGGNGSSTVTGLTAGDDITVTGTSTTQEILISENLFVSGGGLTGSITNDNGLDDAMDGTHTSGVEIELGDTVTVKFNDGSESSFVIAATASNGVSYSGGALNAGVKFTTDIPDEKWDLSLGGGRTNTKAQLFKSVTTITNATIALDPTISSITNITASGGISASHFSGVSIDVTNITASNLLLSGNLDASGSIQLQGSLGFNGLTFIDATAEAISGSNIFGSGSEPSEVTQTFTGSVLITGSGLTLNGGIGAGTITAPSFSGDGSGLTNLSLTELSISDLTQGNGINTFTYNGSNTTTVSVNLSGSTGLIVDSEGLYINDGGISTLQLASDAVTADKIADDAVKSEHLNDDVISGQSTEITDGASGLADNDEFLISDGGTLAKIDVSVLKDYMQEKLNFTDNSNTTYELITSNSGITNGVLITLSGSDNSQDKVQFNGTTDEIEITENVNDDDNATVTIGLPSDVTIGQDLTVTRDLSIGGNTTIAGNLTVQGNTTTLQIQDLIVEDRFIYLASGSNDDNGIVFSSGSQGGGLNQGRLVFYDSTEERFSTARDFDSDLDDANSVNSNQRTGDIVTVKHGQSTLPNADSASFGKGEFYITSDGDIYIYTD